MHEDATFDSQDRFGRNAVPHLARVTIYPVKSLDGLRVDEAQVLKSGALAGDRQFALFDRSGKFVNGKRYARVHALRSSFDPMLRTIALGPREGGGGHDHPFHVDADRAAIDAWLGEFFGFPVTLGENPAAGFPDDTDAPGPTLISTATLYEVASWFPGLDVEQLRRRLRANLEIGGVPAFWEDRLYATAGTVIRFRVGEAVFEGTNPCQRCVVPTRDPDSADAYPNFTKVFTQRRERTLPPWAERSRFNHFYRLAINTKVPPEGAGKTVRAGDAIEVIDAV